MPDKSDDFMTLVNGGRIEEARAWVEAQELRVKYAPDTIRVSKGGKARLTKREKPVELDKDGVWRLKQKEKK